MSRELYLKELVAAKTEFDKAYRVYVGPLTLNQFESKVMGIPTEQLKLPGKRHAERFMLLKTAHQHYCSILNKVDVVNS